MKNSERRNRLPQTTPDNTVVHASALGSFAEFKVANPASAPSPAQMAARNQYMPSPIIPRTTDPAPISGCPITRLGPLICIPLVADRLNLAQ
jgi:hypothetical protein